MNTPEQLQEYARQLRHYPIQAAIGIMLKDQPGAVVKYVRDDSKSRLWAYRNHTPTIHPQDEAKPVVVPVVVTTEGYRGKPITKPKGKKR